MLSSNQERTNRTDISTMSVFGDQISFDIGKSVPLLTTKRVAWKSCIEELLWFMRGRYGREHFKTEESKHMER